MANNRVEQDFDKINSLLTSLGDKITLVGTTAQQTKALKLQLQVLQHYRGVLTNARDYIHSQRKNEDLYGLFLVINRGNNSPAEYLKQVLGIHETQKKKRINELAMLDFNCRSLIIVMVLSFYAFLVTASPLLLMTSFIALLTGIALTGYYGENPNDYDLRQTLVDTATITEAARIRDHLNNNQIKNLFFFGTRYCNESAEHGEYNSECTAAHLSFTPA